MKGYVDVYNRQDSIEVLSFMHALRIPTDSHTGKLSGIRLHSPQAFEKEFYSSSR
ncbi:hypothetical protein [Mixta calida]|uniref:hypothetical protein n=1 Tax=Mixta calida TaxID=665913 RepID=UPI00403B046A